MDKKLTIQEMKERHEKVLESYYGKEKDLIEAVIRCCPKNDNVIEVAKKIAVIDVAYSTNLHLHKRKITLPEFADIITKVNFDKRVAVGDPSLVSDIAKECKDKHKINLFSFTTKYCHVHNTYKYGRADYSIFDSRVAKKLPGIKTDKHQLKKCEIEKWKNDCNYKEFNEYIGNLLDEHDITEKIEPQRRILFDHYLWYE